MDTNCGSLFCTTSFQNIFRPDKFFSELRSKSEQKSRFVLLHLKCPSLLFDINNNWPVPTNFSKLPDIEFHENQFRGSQIVTREQTATDKPKPVNFVQLRCERNEH
jgi:hypothetical protein